MTVRLKIALTIVATGLITALLVIATVLVAFERFEHETTFQRATAFLARVTSTYDNLLDLHDRQPRPLLAFGGRQEHGQVQAQAAEQRERPRGLDRERCQHRQDLVPEVPRHLGALRGVERLVAQQADAALGQRRQDLLVERRVQARHLLVRRQGIGTFVVEHTPADVLFRFFQVQDKAGKQIKPEGLPARSRLEPASKEARHALGLPRKGAANVIVIERVRFHQKKPFVIERIVVPEALFPALANRDDVPNTLYDLFQKQYGLMVTRADERVTPVLAAATDATALNCAIGTPLLRVERIAYGIDDRKLEWRTSHYNLGDGHYFARLK